MTCPSCSAPVRPLATVCTACWTDLDATPEPEPEVVPAAEPEPVAVVSAPAPRAARGWSTPVESWYAPSAESPRARKGRRRH